MGSGPFAHQPRQRQTMFRCASTSISDDSSGRVCQREHQQTDGEIRHGVKPSLDRSTSIRVDLFPLRISKESVLDLQAEVSLAPTPIESCTQKNVELQLKQVERRTRPMFECFRFFFSSFRSSSSARPNRVFRCSWKMRCDPMSRPAAITMRRVSIRTLVSTIE